MKTKLENQAKISTKHFLYLVYGVLLFYNHFFSLSYANECSKTFDPQVTNTKISNKKNNTAFDPQSFIQAMTQNLLLNENQADLFDFYITHAFPHYRAVSGNGDFLKILSILNDNPNLSKIPLRERLIYFNDSLSGIVQKFRLRQLSIQEAPFRSCLGGDCASRVYFEKALDPNYLYFTLTDENHRSTGQVTVVLGATEPILDGEYPKQHLVAFVDKIQGFSINQILGVLEGIRLMVDEIGYKLGIPIPLDKDDVYGISTDPDTRSYINYLINTNTPHLLKNKLIKFNPHHNVYMNSIRPYKGHSKAYDELDLLEINSHDLNYFKNDLNIVQKIEEGEIYSEESADKKLNVHSMIKNSFKSKEEQKKLLKYYKSDIAIGRQFKTAHLNFILQDKRWTFSFRKDVFFTLIEMELETQYKKPNGVFNFSFIKEKLSYFPDAEQKKISKELNQWMNTSHYIEELNYKLL